MGKIKAVMAVPGKTARVTEIGTTLEELQKAVGGGNIEVFYPFEEEVCVICSEEGKYNGMEPCRAIYDTDGKIADIIFGPFLICVCAGEEFTSLSDEQQQKYRGRFFQPEMFVRTGKRICVISCR